MASKDTLFEGRNISTQATKGVRQAKLITGMSSQG